MEQAQDAFLKPMGWSEGRTYMKTKRTAVKVMKLKDNPSKRPMKPKIHGCDKCSKAFGRAPDLVRHVKQVHRRERPYGCPWKDCGRRFSTKTALKNHQTVHTREKLWVCGECSAEFTEQSSCTRHQKEKHKGLTHFCPFCEETAIRTNDFAKHLKSRHNVVLNAEERLLYKMHHSTPLNFLETLPQFNLPGIKGLELRRQALDENTARPRRRTQRASMREPEVVSPSSSVCSYESTPSSIGLSLSPPSPFTDVSDESHASQDGYLNALGIDFGLNGEIPYANSIIHASSTTDLLSDGSSCASSASSLSPGSYTYGFTPSPSPPQQLTFNFTSGMAGRISPYDNANSQTHFGTQTTGASYVYNSQATLGMGMVPSQNQTGLYYTACQPEQVASISHVRRGMAHFSTQLWSS